MPEPFTIERVLGLRRLTRAVADALTEQVSGYLATLGPLFRPRRVLGEHVRGNERDPVKGADRVFRELQALFDNVARAQPFTLARELKSPIDVSSVTLEIHPVEYRHEASVGTDKRAVTVRSPFSWTLSYAGYGPDVLPDLLAHRTGANEELFEWLKHQLILHATIASQPGLIDIMGRLQFPLSFTTEPSSGALPLVRVLSPLSSVRPPDEVIMQSVELSGMDAFEEVINVEDIARMTDALKQRLLQIAAAHGETV